MGARASTSPCGKERESSVKDGQIVWQVTCATCGWKDAEFVADIETGKARAAEHLEAVHGMMCRPLPYELESADAPKD